MKQSHERSKIQSSLGKSSVKSDVIQGFWSDWLIKAEIKIDDTKPYGKIRNKNRPIDLALEY